MNIAWRFHASLKLRGDKGKKGVKNVQRKKG